MNEEELSLLLEKYYNGESTEVEEKRLRDFLKNSNLPAGYETEKEIFNYYSEDENLSEPSSGFEERIMEGIDKAISSKRKNLFKKYFIPFISAAAGILILTGSYFFFVQKSDFKDTFSDPEIAYAETMKILMEVSVKLNQGTNTLEPVSKINELTAKSFNAINKSTIIIEKNFKNMDYLQRAIELTNTSQPSIK
jgi:hypothetical protein